MSRLAIYSEANTGGDRVYLDTLGIVSSLSFDTSFPGGDLAAQWQIAALNPRMTHRALAPGRRIGIPIGTTTAWLGKLQQPQRGDVWNCTAVGRIDDAKRYMSFAPTTGNALALNETVDNAITRGLGWTRPATLSTISNATDTGTITLDDALGQVSDALNQYWQLSRSLALTMSALPSTLTYLLVASDTAGGRTLEDYVTDVYVTYLDWDSYAPTTILRSATSRPFGRVETTLDITNLNEIPLAQAQAAGDAYLAKNGARLRFLGAFTVTRGQLLNPGGVAVDLATVQAGSVIRVLLTDPDTAAGEVALGAVQLVVGQTSYDVDSDTLTVTPLDATQRGFGGYLGLAS